jgi:hypothetical protein
VGWPDTGEISTARRQAFLDRLPASALAGTVTGLSQRRGATLPTARWRRGPNHHGRTILSYVTTVTSTDGSSALESEVMLALPNATSSAIATCAELRINDTSLWAATLQEAGGPDALPPRLSLDEVVEFFVAAWQTATEELPALLVPDPYNRPWTAPPTVELRMTAEQQHEPARRAPRLPDLIEFAELDELSNDHLAEMAVTVTAPPRLTDSERRNLTEQAMTYMGESFDIPLHNTSF